MCSSWFQMCWCTSHWAALWSVDYGASQMQSYGVHRLYYIYITIYQISISFQSFVFLPFVSLSLVWFASCLYYQPCECVCHFQAEQWRALSECEQVSVVQLLIFHVNVRCFCFLNFEVAQFSSVFNTLSALYWMFWGRDPAASVGTRGWNPCFFLNALTCASRTFDPN